MVLLNLNQAYAFFDSAAADPAESGIVALPIRCTTFTWQTAYGTQPAAASILMYGSLDGVNFVEIDDSTEVGGELRTVNGNFTHLMAEIETATDGADISVLIVPKDL